MNVTSLDTTGGGGTTRRKLPKTRAAAQIFAERFKWRVFPVHYPIFTSGGTVYCSCKKRGKCGRVAKHPTTKNGVKDATTDLRQIDAWWHEDPSLNIAIATGVESGIFVLDIDVSNGKPGEESLETLEEKNGKLPDTVEVITGSGGRHLYFKHPGKGVRIKSSVQDEEMGPGIDVRGDGGYVLAPPSTHSSGRVYGFEASSRPTDIAIANAPEWLLALVRDKPRNTAVPAPTAPIDESKWPPMERRVYRAELYAHAATGAIEGERGSDVTMKLALALVVGFVLPSEEALRILEAIYNPKCQPPWSHDELVHKIDSCHSSKLERGYLLSIETVKAPRPELVPPDRMNEYDVPPEAYDHPEAKAPPIQEGVYNTLFTGPAPDPSEEPREARGPAGPSVPPPHVAGGPAPPGAVPPQGAPPGGAPPRRAPFNWTLGDHSEMASALAYTLESREHPLLFDEGEFWRYDEGVWEKIDTDTVETIASNYSSSDAEGVRIQTANGEGKPLRVTDAMIRGGVKILRSRLGSRVPRRRFANAARGICFRNGFVTVKNGRIELRPHSPDHLSRHRFDFDFDPNAKHEKLDTFLDEVFGDADESERAGRAATLQEFIGACLAGDATTYQKCLILSGTGGNGKSQVLTIARSVFPPGSVVSFPPQEWGVRFQAVRLVGVLANFCDEIPEHDITHGDVFKSIVTGDPRHCDVKNRAPMQFVPAAGHIFSANTLPGTVDQSPGFWARWIVVPLTRDFRLLPTRKLDIAKEIVRDEQAGIVLWALQGAARLQQRGSFDITDGSAREMDKWRNEADPVRLWIHEIGAKLMIAHEKLLTPDENRRPTSMLLHKHFKVWAKHNGYKEMNIATFGRRLQSCGLLERVRNRHGSVWCPTKPLLGVVRESIRDMQPEEASGLLNGLARRSAPRDEDDQMSFR